MTVELRKAQLFNVRVDTGDDNDNYADHYTYRAYSFSDIVDLFIKETCESRHSDNVECNDSMNDGDGESFNVWHDLTFTCDECWGTGWICDRSNTHDAYTAQGITYVECDECQECRNCEGNGGNSIPLHDTITLEDVITDESDTYGTIIDLIDD